MSKLFIMAGTKGGIGKTLVATLFADAATDFGYRTVLFDCDDENHSFYNAMKTRTVKEQILDEVVLEVNTENDFPLDKVMNKIIAVESDKKQYPGDNIYIIDLKTGSTSKMLDWMQAFPFDLLHMKNLKVNVIGVVTNDPDSVTTYIPWFKTFKPYIEEKKLEIITILNEVDGKSMQQFHATLEPYLVKNFPDSPVIILQNLSRNYLTLFRELNTSYGRIGKEKEIDLSKLGWMGIIRCQNEFKVIKEHLAPIFEMNSGTGDKK